MELLRNYAGDAADTTYDKTLTRGKDIVFNIFAVSEGCPLMTAAPLQLSAIKASDKLTKATSSANPVAPSTGSH